MAKEWPTFDIPADVRGDQLEAELKTAGVEAEVMIVDDQLRVTCEDKDCSKVEAVLAAHVPSEPERTSVRDRWNLSDEDIAELKALLR